MGKKQFGKNASNIEIAKVALLEKFWYGRRVETGFKFIKCIDGGYKQANRQTNRARKKVEE